MSVLSYFPQGGGGGGEALCFKNVIVNASAWGASTYNASYPYEATISLSGATSSLAPVVVFSPSDDRKYSFLDAAQSGANAVTIYAKKAPASAILIPAIALYETIVSNSIGSLEDTDWAVISAIAQAGAAGDFWSVGDTKSVVLNGTVGTLSLDTTLYVYIIGINHEGVNGITFQGFKTAATDGINVALVSDITYRFSDGTLSFNMNHWGDSSASPYNTNYGGWKGCDLRYDILGSTDTAPGNYGSAHTIPHTGFDASETTATNPVSNTLMAAMPSALRAVMRPMTVYTDNCLGSSHNDESYVTATVDYLPLLAEFEVFGTRSYANQYEQNYQTQYAYYANGVSKLKRQHSDTTSLASQWERSPSYYNNGVTFCYVTPSGAASTYESRYSCGLAPIFLV